MLYRKATLKYLLVAALAITCFTNNCAAEIQQDDKLSIEMRIEICESIFLLGRLLGGNLEQVDYAIIYSQCREHEDNPEAYEECARMWIDRFSAWCTPFILVHSTFFE